MGEIRQRLARSGRWLAAGCLLISALCFLAAYAIAEQAREQTRGLELGAPLNRPQNIYGLNVHLLETEDQLDELAALKAAGFGWVRQAFDWQTLDWEAADAAVAAARANDLGLVAVLTGVQPPDPVEFSEFAGQFAGRYRDQLDHYQIWDEPNLALGWNGRPSPAEYARVLQAAYSAIHAADPTATVLLAGLAPTIETGPKNLSDVLYLRQLYELGAQPYFDAVAGKPYGFNTGPDDRKVEGGVLNFSRLILLREEMLAHGDGDKFIWGANFGWNTRLSIWGRVSPEQQTNYTLEAFSRAANEWQWAGPLFIETPRPGEETDDPHMGFRLDLELINRPQPTILPGRYTAQALNAYAIFDGAWKFSELGADIPREPPATITLNFIGTTLDITTRRADYRAYLYVTLDGGPANALPTDPLGRTYLILTSPDLQPHTDTHTLAAGLAPGPHTAVIRADRGWDQWALVSFAIGPNIEYPNSQLPLTLLAGVGGLSALAFLYLLRLTLDTPRLPVGFRLNDLTQTFLTAIVSLILWASAWLTWGSDAVSAFRRYGDGGPLLLTVLTAGLLYYSPFLILTLISLAALLILFYLRPDLSLPLIAFFAPFYLIPRPLWDRAFSMVEICTLLGLAAVMLRGLSEWRKHYTLWRLDQAFLKQLAAKLIGLDWAIIAFVIVSLLSIFTADIRGVAIREFRVVVLESALFYLLLRVVLAQASPTAGEAEHQRRLWRVVDFFILGAVVVSAYGLLNLVTGQNLITAEGGLPRIRSVFGSPNNLGLYLGRAIPVAAAIVVLAGSRGRRILYGLALLPMLTAAAFSFSRGALIFGLPAALIVILLFWGRRKALIALAGLAAAGGLAYIPLSRLPRFATLFSIASGSTGFFRVNIWRSAWAMFLDHPWLGVGLDNFLYAYRGRYIQPEAWQEPNLPHAHNIFLDALTRTGLFGFFALIAILGSFFKLSFQLLRPVKGSTMGLTSDLRALAIGLLAAMIASLAHGLVDTAYWFVDLGFVFMMILGLMAALSQTARPNGAGAAIPPSPSTQTP